MTTERIRLGYHGSAQVADNIVFRAGWNADAVDLKEYDVADPFKLLRVGELDVMIVKFGLDEPDLARSADLAHELRAVILGAGHELGDRASVSVEELAVYDTFDRPGDMPAYVWDAVVPHRTPEGRTLRRRHRVSSVPEMMALVASGAAVHISLASLADIAPPGIRVIPVHDLPPAPVALAWVKSPEPPAHVRGFIAAAEQGKGRGAR